MTDLASYRRRLQSRLAELAAELRVPGAACGVLEGGETVVATTGVANVATRAPVTPDTLFQIGSITKLYTTTLVMQAVAAGVVSLDDSVRSQLQEFTVADPAATIEITPRHLLAHSGGLEGDHLVDTGWNDDALAAYVSTLAGLGQIHPTAAAYSFCNTGYGVLGRLLEVATGEHFDRVLRRRLTRPLGCRATVTLPQHALLHAVAVGHEQEPGGEPVRQPRWALTRSNGPMGGVLAPPGELLAFARMHLEGGAGPDGTVLLAPEAVEEMRQPQIASPIPNEAQALGWTVRHWGDLTCLGQDADTFGQRAVLRVVPERDFAVCVLTNSPAGAVLAQAMLELVAADRLEVALNPTDPVAGGRRDLVAVAGGARTGAPSPATPAVDPSALARWAGTYERLHHRVVVRPGGHGLELATEPSGVLRALGVRDAVLSVQPVGAGDDGSLVVAGRDPATGLREVAVLVPGDAGGAPGLYLAGRLHRRRS